MHPDLLKVVRMRALLAIAVLSFAVAGGAARGADFAGSHFAFHSSRYFERGERAGMLLVDAYEPGVALRAYWRTPWRGHHYFPATGKRPRLGRVENMFARVARPRPAQTFRRTWSNASAFKQEQPIYVLPPERERRLAAPHEMKP
jgi:hypothetical protein